MWKVNFGFVLASVAILPVLRTSEPRDAALAQLPAAATTTFAGM